MTCDDTSHALETAAKVSKEHGALTMSVYSTDDAVLARAEDLAADAGVMGAHQALKLGKLRSSWRRGRDRMGW